jgi:hypothetical protein
MALQRSRRLPTTRVGLAPLGIAFAHRLVFVAVCENIREGCSIVTNLWQNCGIWLMGHALHRFGMALDALLCTPHCIEVCIDR